MKHILKTAIIATLGLLLFSCKGKEDGVVTTIVNDTVPEHDSIAPIASAPKPVEVFTNDTVTVKGYKWEGLNHFLTQSNDTIYVVNFWATWCQPCVEELPHFEEINKKYKENKVKVLLVSMDFGKDITTKLLPFIGRRQLKSDVIVMRETDGNSWISKVDSTWSGALPATVIYSKKVRKFYEKSFTYAELEKEISNFK